MLNKQIPIKQDLVSTGDSLLVNSIFFTIQGEGPFAGTPSVFIRLAGCNLQCPACDTEYTESVRIIVQDIVDKTIDLIPLQHIRAPVSSTRPLVVITGGEPFRQNIYKLIDKLIETGFKVQIETNGTLYLNLGWLFMSPHLTIVCSPKAGKVNRELEKHIKAYKYVLSADSVDPDDGLPTLALDHTASPRVARPPQRFVGDVFIQPIDVQDPAENDRHMNAAVASSLQFGYRLCLQVHKLIGVP